MKYTEKDNADFLRWAEEAMRDISTFVEHSGTMDKMIADIKGTLKIYWQSKNERRKEINAGVS